MIYHAIQARSPREAIDDAIGPVIDIKHMVFLFTSVSKEDIERQIKAYFSNHPEETIVLIDKRRRVHRVYPGERQPSKEDWFSGGLLGAFFVLASNLLLGFLVGWGAFWPTLPVVCLYLGASAFAYQRIVKRGILDCFEATVSVVTMSILAWIPMVWVLQ